MGSLKKSGIVLGMLVALLPTLGCNQNGQALGGAPSEIKFSTPYQAVFLDNGQVVFGQLEKTGSDYPVLRNAYFVRNQVNQETKEVHSQLLKRSVTELHNPDYIVLNARHIVTIEPVAVNSKVGQLLSQGEAQATGQRQP